MRPRAATFAATLAATLSAAGAETPPLAPVSCLIEPEAVVQLATAVAGVVAEVNVDRGDRVTAGQPIARLDGRVEEIARDLARTRATNLGRVRSLEARLAFLEAQAERMTALSDRSAISATQADEARMQAAMAREELAEARLAVRPAAIEAAPAAGPLEQKTVRAPFDGLITERLLSPGEYRDGQTHIATIVRLDVLRVEAFAPIAYFPHLAVGQTVIIRPEAPIGGAHTATITVIDRVFDAATGTFGFRMALPNPDLALPAGLRCEVEFPAGG
jgi:RND family efflux transporter MFP subunit